VRQLVSTERAHAAFGRETTLLDARCYNSSVATIEHLPTEILEASPAAAARNAATCPMAHEAASLGDFEHLAIKRALESSHGNLTQAARALGISRSTLYRKVQRYHLEPVIKPSR
jgi:transcriptional regulator of acetoin/glycerol metabolism